MCCLMSSYVQIKDDTSGDVAQFIPSISTELNDDQNKCDVRNFSDELKYSTEMLKFILNIADS